VEPRHLDSYSFPPPGEPLCDWLRVLMDRLPNRPVVPSSWELLLPQVVEADDRLLPASRLGAGRPARIERPYDATEVAIARDVEAMPLSAEREWRTRNGVAAVSDGATGLRSTLCSVTYSRESWTSKTQDRWRNDGRRLLGCVGRLALGAYGANWKASQALVGENAYAEALHLWATGLAGTERL
jgi:hypothetical protein